jgi:hypothetical protein
MYDLVILELPILRAICVNFFNIMLAKNSEYVLEEWPAIAQSVQRLASGWTFQGSSRSRSEIFPTCPD